MFPKRKKKKESWINWSSLQFLHGSLASHISPCTSQHQISLCQPELSPLFHLSCPLFLFPLVFLWPLWLPSVPGLPFEPCSVVGLWLLEHLVKMFLNNFQLGFIFFWLRSLSPLICLLIVFSLMELLPFKMCGCCVCAGCWWCWFIPNF